jgi:GTPase SAR1 family protein
MPRLASAYIVLYSCDSRRSFEHAQQVLQNIRANVHTRNRPVILAGNKIDLARRKIISDTGKST